MPRRANAAESVAVVGGGAIGSATAWRLAQRGHRVVLFEQYAAGHLRGGTHGSSRIFRYSYPLTEYVALAGRATRLWRRLERLDGQRFYARTGSVDHGDPARVQRLTRALLQAGIEHSVLTPRAAELQWPGLRFDGMVLHHPDSGRLHADLAVAALQRRARVAGAETWFHTPAIGLRVSPSGVRVLTASGSIRFDQVVLAAGAWTADLLASIPGLAKALPPLVTTQEQPVHFAPSRHRSGGRVSCTTRAPSTPAPACTAWPRRTASRSASTGPATAPPPSAATSNRNPQASRGCRSMRPAGCPASTRPR
jgi:sarcosine oxidase